MLDPEKTSEREARLALCELGATNRRERKVSARVLKSSPNAPNQIGPQELLDRERRQKR